MVCPSVREENPRALASELSHVQMTENKSTSSNHENSNNYFFAFFKKNSDVTHIKYVFFTSSYIFFKIFLFVPYRCSHWKGL